MAAIESIRRVLMPGLVFGALIVAATASSAGPIVPGAPAGALGTLLYVQGPGGSDALLRFAHKSPFCRWHPGHRLCAELVTLLTFCDRRPDHRLCQPPDHDRFCKSHRGHPLCDADRFCSERPDHGLCVQAADDRFCGLRPDHPLCGDDRFCSKRPNHPLCENPPSPS